MHISRFANGNFYLQKLFGDLYVIRDHIAADVISFRVEWRGRVLRWESSRPSQNSCALDKPLPITTAWLKEVTTLSQSQFLCKMRSLNYVF